MFCELLDKFQSKGKRMFVLMNITLLHERLEFTFEVIYHTSKTSSLIKEIESTLLGFCSTSLSRNFAFLAYNFLLFALLNSVLLSRCFQRVFFFNDCLFHYRAFLFLSFAFLIWYKFASS